MLIPAQVRWFDVGGGAIDDYSTLFYFTLKCANAVIPNRVM